MLSNVKNNIKKGFIMVSNLSIFFICLSIALSVLFPVILIIYFYKKEHISAKPVLVGALIWLIFSMILENILHSFVLRSPIYKMAVPFAIYAALAAGLFEETGRFIGFKYFLKNNREWKDGIAYGIGHGGIEAVLIGGLGSINNLVYSLLINSGTFDTLIGSKLPSATSSALKNSLIKAVPYSLGLGGLERIFAVTFHIAMSLLVLYGIRNRKNIYLLFAIIAHALFDFIPALYQVHIVKNIYMVESLVGIVAIVLFIIMTKSKALFEKVNEKSVSV